MKIVTLSDFYQDVFPATEGRGPHPLSETLADGLGHFNVFRIAEMARQFREKNVMPYNRRTYYKISLIVGHNVVEYADKVIEVKHQGLLFATPKVPYRYVPQDEHQEGYFCVFTEEFLRSLGSRADIDELPLFQSGGDPVLQLSDAQRDEAQALFLRMEAELGSGYAYKYDMLRSYLLQLIHFGQKLMPIPTAQPSFSASERIASLFVELLERQFPLESPRQQLRLRTPKEYADRLAIHVNHLNKTLKDSTGQTTTALIGSRIAREAKILLRHTDWSVSEIGWSLGFEEVAHFSNFFRRHAKQSPQSFRTSAVL